MAALLVLTACEGAGVDVEAIRDDGLAEVALADAELPDPVVDALGTASHQDYSVYEFPVPGDFANARRGEWTGAITIGDPTVAGRVVTRPVQLAGLGTDLGYHVTDVRASHLLTTENGGPIGVITSSRSAISLELDLDNDRVADIVDRVDLTTGREFFMVAADQLWALEELLQGRNLLCHPRVAELDGLVFTNFDEEATSPAACDESASPVKDRPRLTAPGTAEEFLDGICSTYKSTPDAGPVDLGFVSDKISAGYKFGAGAIALGGVVVVAGLPLVGAGIAAFGMGVITGAALDDAQRPADAGGEGGSDEDPPPGVDHLPSAEEAWQRLCGAREDSGGQYPYTIEELEAAVSPVDNQCDDPFTAARAAEGASEPVTLCGASEGDRVRVVNVSDVLSSFDDEDCRDETEPQRLCEPSVLRGNVPGGATVAWTAGGLYGLEPCPPENCDPSG